MLVSNLTKALGTVMLVFQYVIAGNGGDGAPSVPKFDWSSLEAAHDLLWHKCYSTTTPSKPTQQVFHHSYRTPYCARLSIQLDYHNTSNPATITLALLKLSAPSSTRRKTIIFAPGGGGESRIKMTLAVNEVETLDQLDPDLEFDFVTWDNRGTVYSLPKAECFDSIAESQFWDGRVDNLSDVISSEDEDGLRA